VSGLSAPELLITGATGFVGGHLVERLRADTPLRVLVRDAGRLRDPDGLDVVEGDLGDPEALSRALDGCRGAYYLVHSMEPGDGGQYAQRDHDLAEGFARAAGEAGVQRIAYLGGVESSGSGSEHLDSRHDVERVLGEGPAELVGLRASMVVGAESDSFRTLAQIVDRMPVLALPDWRDTRTQPVAIADVIAALVAAAGPDVAPGSYEIAGPDTVTIAEMVEIIGELLGERRPTFPIPIGNSALEGAVASVFTDSSRDVLQPLLEGLHDDLLVEHDSLQETFGVTPTPFR
jgi:uncharacterized protein YbjT (DUF2867 family)